MTLERKTRIQIVSAGLALVLISYIASFFLPTFIYVNPTESLPLGFYRVSFSQDLHVGDIVTFDTPPSFEAMLERRGYLDPKATLMKQLLATSGETYCITDDQFIVNGKLIGPIFEHDSIGRIMPKLEKGCFDIPKNHVLVGSYYHQNSFDSRYFGPISASSLRKKMEPLWTW